MVRDSRLGVGVFDSDQGMLELSCGCPGHSYGQRSWRERRAAENGGPMTQGEPGMILERVSGWTDRTGREVTCGDAESNRTLQRTEGTR